jgi:hypothetical protein
MDCGNDKYAALILISYKWKSEIENLQESNETSIK